MLHVTGARCVARDLYTTVPAPLKGTCWDSSRRSKIVKIFDLRLSVRLLLLLLIADCCRLVCSLFSLV